MHEVHWWYGMESCGCTDWHIMRSDILSVKVMKTRYLDLTLQLMAIPFTIRTDSYISKSGENIINGNNVVYVTTSMLFLLNSGWTCMEVAWTMHCSKKNASKYYRQSHCIHVKQVCIRFTCSRDNTQY